MRRGPKGGTCRYCRRRTESLTRHELACDGGPSVDEEARLILRAGTVAAPESTLRAAQRFQSGVTDLDAARVMRGVEMGVRLRLTGAGRWVGPTGSPLSGPRTSPTVHEMIRTGLLRDWRGTLIPASVHLVSRDGVSVCLFVGEDMGPMRARLTGDIDLVDCQHCLMQTIV